MRQAAARALGHIDDARVVDLLIATTEDQQGDVRAAAAEALGHIDDARAVKPLITVLGDGDTVVRRAAAEALDELAWSPDSGEAGAAYWLAKSEWDECVRIGAPAVEPLVSRAESPGGGCARGRRGGARPHRRRPSY